MMTESPCLQAPSLDRIDKKGPRGRNSTIVTGQDRPGQARPRSRPHTHADTPQARRAKTGDATIPPAHQLVDPDQWLGPRGPRGPRLGRIWRTGHPPPCLQSSFKRSPRPLILPLLPPPPRKFLTGDSPKPTDRTAHSRQTDRQTHTPAFLCTNGRVILNSQRLASGCYPLPPHAPPFPNPPPSVAFLPFWNRCRWLPFLPFATAAAQPHQTPDTRAPRQRITAQYTHARD